MFAILPTQERFTAKTLGKDNIGFLSEKAILSLISHILKRRNPVEVQLWQRDFTVTEFQTPPLEYENTDVLQFLSDYYIFQLKLKQCEFQENIQTSQGIPTKTPGCTLPTKSRSPNLQNQELQITQDRLIELLQEDDEDEYGILKPTPYAFDKAWNLVLAASQFLGNSFKRASASTDDEGGVRLTWTRLEPEDARAGRASSAEVRLICPSEPNKQIYLYHEKESHYGVVKDVSGFTLASWLKWLNQV